MDTYQNKRLEMAKTSMYPLGHPIGLVQVGDLKASRCVHYVAGDE